MNLALSLAGCFCAGVLFAVLLISWHQAREAAFVRDIWGDTSKPGA